MSMLHSRWSMFLASLPRLQISSQPVLLHLPHFLHFLGPFSNLNKRCFSFTEAAISSFHHQGSLCLLISHCQYYHKLVVYLETLIFSRSPAGILYPHSSKTSSAAISSTGFFLSKMPAHSSMVNPCDNGIMFSLMGDPTS